jgi:hypothetical protein
MANKETKLKLMRYWMFGVFVLIFAATATYTGGALGFGLMIIMHPNFWLTFALVAAFTVFWYYVYRWALGIQANLFGVL